MAANDSPVNNSLEFTNLTYSKLIYQMLILKLGVFRFENSKPRILKFMVFDELKIPKNKRQSAARNFLKSS